jgi:hypothetical protein
LIPEGKEVTVPEPAPDLVRVREHSRVGSVVKVAVTFLSEVTLTIQVLPVGESQPVQELKAEPKCGEL